ncbi:hypothetical protein ACEK07_44345 [Alcanivoracaceae bacterium MT1]
MHKQAMVRYQDFSGDPIAGLNQKGLANAGIFHRRSDRGFH